MTTQKRRIAPGAAAFLFGLLSVGVAVGEPLEAQLYEKTLMARAGARCRLFSPEIAAALGAAQAEVRAAAQRDGLSAPTVLAAEARAEAKADATPCGSKDLTLAAGRVRKAYEGYASLPSMAFPGRFATWLAVRRPWPMVADGKVVPGPRWRLSEAAVGLGGVFVVGQTGGSELLALKAGGGDPAGARLILRDPEKAPAPYLDLRRPDLSGRAPRRDLTEVFLASSLGPAPRTLLPAGVSSGVLAVFPARAAEALARLDPREAASVEFVYPLRSGERVEAAFFEVGDVSAARTFLAAGR